MDAVLAFVLAPQIAQLRSILVSYFIHIDAHILLRQNAWMRDILANGPVRCVRAHV